MGTCPPGRLNRQQRPANRQAAYRRAGATRDRRMQRQITAAANPGRFQMHLCSTSFPCVLPTRLILHRFGGWGRHTPSLPAASQTQTQPMVPPQLSAPQLHEPSSARSLPQAHHVFPPRPDARQRRKGALCCRAYFRVTFFLHDWHGCARGPPIFSRASFPQMAALCWSSPRLFSVFRLPSPSRAQHYTLPLPTHLPHFCFRGDILV